jgi:hypothetical protein
MLSSRTMISLYQYVSTLYLVPWCGRVSPLIAGKKCLKCIPPASGQAVGMWVAQELQEIGLLVALADDTVRDLYWCAVLKFMRDLYLTAPSAAGMLAILGRLEPGNVPEGAPPRGWYEGIALFSCDPRGPQPPRFQQMPETGLSQDLFLFCRVISRDTASASAKRCSRQ